MVLVLVLVLALALALVLVLVLLQEGNKVDTYLQLNLGILGGLILQK